MSGRRVGVVVQARMGSTRLPGKILEPVGDTTVLGLLLDRLSRCRRIDAVVVATTTAELDDTLAEWCRRRGTSVFRGSEQDVLERYVRCAAQYGLSSVVRVTGDNPLTDPEGIDDLVVTLEREEYVYAHNKHAAGYPFGTGAEAITTRALLDAARRAEHPYDREHVTTYVLRHPELFPTGRLDAPEELQAPDVFLTVDYPEDLLLLRRLHRITPVVASGRLRNYLQCLREHPEIALLNRHLHVGFDHGNHAQVAGGR